MYAVTPSGLLTHGTHILQLNTVLTVANVQWHTPAPKAQNARLHGAGDANLLQVSHDCLIELSVQVLTTAIRGNAQLTVSGSVTLEQIHVTRFEDEPRAVVLSCACVSSIELKISKRRSSRDLVQSNDEQGDHSFEPAAMNMLSLSSLTRYLSPWNRLRHLSRQNIVVTIYLDACGGTGIIYRTFELMAVFTVDNLFTRARSSTRNTLAIGLRCDVGCSCGVDETRSHALHVARTNAVRASSHISRTQLFFSRSLVHWAIMVDNDFDEQRERNMARNRALIAGLDIGQNAIIQTKKPRPAKHPKVTKSNKRKASDDAEELNRPAKAATVIVADIGGLRRSGRNAGKTINYKDDGELAGARSRPQVVSEAARKAEENEPRESMKRTNEPCAIPIRMLFLELIVDCRRTYGAIPGVEVGTWWETRYALVRTGVECQADLFSRQACSADAIHA